MDGKIERAFDSSGIGKKEGKGQQNRVAGFSGDTDGTDRHFTPLLVDSNQGARILGISQSHFYKFMRNNKSVSPVLLGSLNLWRKNDLLRFTGKPRETQSARDVLIDAQEIATLCAISRSMVYKLNEQHAMPEPILDGRTMRWSFQAIQEWIDAGCPKRRKRNRREGR